jgi:hypothetical protein
MREEAPADYIHFTTSPPGQPLVHYWLAEATDGFDAVSKPVSLALRPYQCGDLQIMRYSRGEMVSAGVGMLIPLWAALAVIPIFFVGRSLSGGDGQAAARLSQWWPLAPSVLLFSPTWNTLYPVLVMAAFALLAAGLNQTRLSPTLTYSLAAGGVMSATTFLNFSALPVLIVMGLFALGCKLTTPQRTWRWLLLVGLSFGLGLSAVWLIFWLYASHSPFEILRVSLEQHREIAGKSHLAWLVLHPYDVFLFAGWPLAGLAGWGVWRVYRRWRSKTRLDALDLLAVSLLIVWALLDLSGSVQGENARILMFLAPFLLLMGMPLFTRSAFWDFPLLTTQAATVAVLAAALPVVPLDLNPQVKAPRADIPAMDYAPLQPMEATFSSVRYEGEFRLEGYRFVADPAAQAITLELNWRGVRRSERPYYFELVAYAENEIDGQIQSAPYRWYPQGGNYLTPCWCAGDAVREVIIMPLPVVSMPVVWRLELRALDERTGDVMRVRLPEGSAVAGAPLGPINYP